MGRNAWRGKPWGIFRKQTWGADGTYWADFQGWAATTGNAQPSMVDR